MNPYDAILGFDWMQSHSPMECHWKQKTLQFLENGRHVKRQVLLDPPMQLSLISASKVYNATKGNDIWAFVLLDHVLPNATTEPDTTKQTPELDQLLQSYEDVFNDPQTLPPHRSYDHAIPLVPGSIPINPRPYHYSPLHKTEMENQVKQLLQAGLIAHSHSPFASPVS